MANGLPSVMNHAFSKIPVPGLQRSTFDRSHGHKTTFDAGYLIPLYLDEVLPGDTVSLQTTVVARLATLLFPIMDNLHLDVHHFYCPNRLLWDNWERFNGAQDDPGDSIDFLVPTIAMDEGSADFAADSLGDYFGLPTDVPLGALSPVSALPFRMYQKIYNEWYRDQNLQDSAICPTDDGPDQQSDVDVLRRRGKKHDYFTSCLPWPQKGDAVPLPLGDSAPVHGTGQTLQMWDGTTEYRTMFQDNTGFNTIYGGRAGAPVAAGTAATGGTTAGDVYIGVTTNPLTSGLVADLSTATSATLNDLRDAIAVQHILEADARGGTRYVEQMRTRWKVTVPDFRLQRPEYLGGSTHRVDVTTVAQTSEAGGTPQANLSGYGRFNSQSGFVKSFDEHGFIMTLINVRADITYQQGMNRLWSRQTRFDFYMPELAHLGEQPVYNREIFTQGQAVGAPGFRDEDVFGYQERWAEYRYKPSMVTGAFRSNYGSPTPNPLDAWHLALDFSALPALNDTFIEDNPPIDRVIAVPGTTEAPQPQVIADSFIRIKHTRPMPVYSVPGLERL